MITGKTKLYGLFAHPAQHSLSPMMHNLAFKYHGIDARYMAFDVAPEAVTAALSAIRTLDLGGVNLSMPLKERVLPQLDWVAENAQLIGAVNTIKNDHGFLRGYNTDGLGLLQALPQTSGLEGKQLLIFGAGGAAKAAAVEAALNGVRQITIVNRHTGPNSRGQQLVTTLQQVSGVAVELLALADLSRLKAAMATADIVVNATGLGMGAHLGESPVPDKSYFTAQMIAFEMIYAPAESKFLQQARQAGVQQSFNGLPMLIQQGAAAFEIWTSQAMPIELVKNKLNND
ncbi:shikimate dehydrogenase [Lactobacillus sp. CC-MHH1034]|uniref:shikimate dehydrogenase n=1 Tax=Agrilactobacillus fermenti TaxID=2586909 RepID=UPI001E314CB6|nr:shikimate dehydrogenase [Agrilactobacillus fermenti]MCD2255655.1 shikimate dehydrogenase [Agrilactobacillus fermenti]